jgi:hypothetical protein
MEAAKRRNIRSGAQYDHLFPGAEVDTHTGLKNAGVGDTVSFIPRVVSKTLAHTKGLAGIARGRNDYETCRNIWQFVYDHIAYRKDKDGYEQIRSPARSWHDRKEGVDCDCYTTFISSTLTNLGIKHKLRITKYSRDYFQHIYPIALLQGKEVILDCVTEKFDYEVPYSEKKDYNMDLQYLNGLGATGNDYLRDNEGMEELGRLFGKKPKGGGIFRRIGKSLKHLELKKILNAVNRINPATVLLRNGVLASMKLNIGNVAKRIRWSYLSPEQARAKGMDMDKWQRLVRVKDKLEEIFYGAGGKPQNLKNAILRGKGNKDKSVQGIDGLGSFNDYGFSPDHPNHPLNRLTRHTPIRELLGDELFYSENSVGALGELGEPVTLASIAAASGVLATIAASIKKIGDLFGGKGSGSKDFNEEANKAGEKEIAENASSGEGAASAESPSGDSNRHNYAEKAKRFAEDSPGSGAGSGGSSPGSEGGGSTVVARTDNQGGGASEVAKSSQEPTTRDAAPKDPVSPDAPKEGFWDKNKKWMIPTGIGVVGLGVIALAVSSSKTHPSKPMHGTPPKKQKGKTKAKPRPSGKLKSKGLL